MREYITATNARDMVFKASTDLIIMDNMINEICERIKNKANNGYVQCDIMDIFRKYARVHWKPVVNELCKLGYSVAGYGSIRVMWEHDTPVHQRITVDWDMVI